MYSGVMAAGWEGCFGAQECGDRGECVAGGCSPDSAWIGPLGLRRALLAWWGHSSAPQSAAGPRGSSLPVLGAGWQRREDMGEQWPCWGAPGLDQVNWVGKAPPWREVGSEQGEGLEETDFSWQDGRRGSRIRPQHPLCCCAGRAQPGHRLGRAQALPVRTAPCTSVLPALLLRGRETFPPGVRSRRVVAGAQRLLLKCLSPSCARGPILLGRSERSAEPLPPPAGDGPGWAVALKQP